MHYSVIQLEFVVIIYPHAVIYQTFLLGDFVGRKSEERLGGVPAEARREERAENGEGPD